MCEATWGESDSCLLTTHWPLGVAFTVHRDGGQARGEGGDILWVSERGGSGVARGHITLSLRCVHRAPLVHSWWESPQDRPSRPGPEPPALSCSVPKTAPWDTPNFQGGQRSYSQKFYLFIFCNCREDGENQRAPGAGRLQAARWRPARTRCRVCPLGQGHRAFPQRALKQYRLEGLGPLGSVLLIFFFLIHLTIETLLVPGS